MTKLTFRVNLLFYFDIPYFFFRLYVLNISFPPFHFPLFASFCLFSHLFASFREKSLFSLSRPTGYLESSSCVFNLTFEFLMFIVPVQNRHVFLSVQTAILYPKRTLFESRWIFKAPAFTACLQQTIYSFF